MKNTHSYPTEADRALAESARGDWARISNQSIPLAAVVLILVVGHDKPIREAKHRVANPIALDDERNHS